MHSCGISTGTNLFLAVTRCSPSLGTNGSFVPNHSLRWTTWSPILSLPLQDWLPLQLHSITKSTYQLHYASATWRCGPRLCDRACTITTTWKHLRSWHQ